MLLLKKSDHFNQKHVKPGSSIFYYEVKKKLWIYLKCYILRLSYWVIYCIISSSGWRKYYYKEKYYGCQKLNN